MKLAKKNVFKDSEVVSCLYLSDRNHAKVIFFYWKLGQEDLRTTVLASQKQNLAYEILLPPILYCRGPFDFRGRRTRTILLFGHEGLQSKKPLIFKWDISKQDMYYEKVCLHFII